MINNECAAKVGKVMFSHESVTQYLLLTRVGWGNATLTHLPMARETPCRQLTTLSKANPHLSSENAKCAYSIPHNGM